MIVLNDEEIVRLYYERSEDGIHALLARLDEIDRAREPAALTDAQLSARLRLDDMMTTQRQVLSAMLFALHSDEPGVVETADGESRRRPARPLPERELWFERVWSKYREETRV